MKNKIIIFTPNLTQGGVEHSLITALNGFNYDKNDVTLYLYKNDLTLLPQVPAQVKVILGFDDAHYYRRPFAAFLLLECAICKLFRLEKKSRRINNRLNDYIHNIKVLYPYRHYFTKEKFDVVISYCLHMGTEMALRISADKHYLFLHNSHTDYHQDIFWRCQSEYDAIFAVSEGVKNEYCSEYPILSNKMFVLDNFVDGEEIIKKAKELKISDSNTSLVFCTCGRLATEKGFDLAVDAAALLKKEKIDFLWYFVGDGYDRNQIERHIQEKDLKDNILITGYQDNPYPYMAACDIYIQPSYEESQGLAIYEALLLGKAIVCTDTVGGRCTLSNGEKGVLTDITANGIAQGVLSILNNKDLKLKLESMNELQKNKRDKVHYYALWNSLLEGEI